MRTVTEFAALTIKNAAKTQQELTAAGKTAEELPAAMGEALKLEGDRLNHLLGALEVAGNRLDDLKRVLVIALNEGETAPSGAQQKGEQWLIAEYFAPLVKKGAHPAEDRSGKRGDKRGDRRGKRGPGRGGDKDRGGRPPRGPRAEGGPKGAGPKPVTSG